MSNVKKILLIEDNKEISENIKSYLELDNFSVEIASSWDIWLEKAINWKHDLILLDLILPVIDWFTVCERLNKKISTPIIITTAKDSIDDKIKWFEKWSTDYIVKPFDLRELDIRIKSVLERSKIKNSNFFKFKDEEENKVIEISMENRIFKKDWENINITQKEFLILESLFNNLERWVSRTNIIEYVWWESAIFDWDAKLDVYISSIRSKLSKKLIKTIKTFWYKINN